MAVYVGILEGEGDVWSIRIPDVPGCHGGGASPEAAIVDAESALRFVVADMVAEGQVVPAPRSVDEVVADPNAQFNAAAGERLVRIPLELDTVHANKTGSTA